MQQFYIHMEVTSHTYGRAGIGAQLFALKGAGLSKLKQSRALGFGKPWDKNKKAGNESVLS